MEKNKYIARTVTFIQENNFSEISKDPTEKYQRQIKGIIKNAPKIFRNKKNNDPDMLTANQSSNTLALPRHNRINRYWVNNSPSAPVMKAFLKIHKNNIPIKPTVQITKHEN
jgi:hypothetical protein